MIFTFLSQLKKRGGEYAVDIVCSHKIQNIYYLTLYRKNFANLWTKQFITR